jgi:hypothetical protein
MERDYGTPETASAGRGRHSGEWILTTLKLLDSRARYLSLALSGASNQALALTGGSRNDCKLVSHILILSK